MKGNIYIILRIFVLSLLFSSNIFSQKKTSFRLYQDGHKYLRKKDTINAIKSLKQAITIKPNYRATLLLGGIYYSMDSLDIALKIYKEGFKLDSSYYLAYRLANFYFDDLQDYKTAEKYYSFFINKSPKNSSVYYKAKKRLRNSIFAKQAVKNPVSFSPKNVGNGINKREGEYTPSISSNQKMLIYTKMIPTKQGRVENLYYSFLIDSTWQEGIPLPGKINTKYNEGAPYISANGRFMIFTGCNRYDGKGSCDIYFSIFGEEGWGHAHNFGENINTKHWEAGASLSPDGKTLYFSSSRGGGKGGKDIWYSEFKYGKWRKAKNLSIVNTKGDEETPFIHIDNKTLYFSSNGLDGMGGLDFFVSKKDSIGNWQTPENLGYPINTPKEEYSLSVARDGKTAFFATNSIPDNQGSMDIYYFELPNNKRANPTGYIKGYITNKEGQVIRGAKMSIYDIYSGEKVKGFSFEDGKYFGTLEKNKTYAFQVIKKNYMLFSKNIKLKEDSLDLEFDIMLKKIKIGEIAFLNNILFEYNKASLKKQSIIELKKTIEFLNLNNNVSIEIGGHTDNVGSKSYNKKLSKNRAKSVYDFLIENKIKKSRLSYKGYGFSKPLNKNKTEKDKQQNRRTEIRIINNN